VSAAGLVADVRITFQLNDRSLGKKTDVWEVWRRNEASLRLTSHAGQVRWHSPWRRYCFFPSAGTVWEQDCLRSIAEFIESETAKHRKGKRAFLDESCR
jgi:hypothetical protein